MCCWDKKAGPAAIALRIVAFINVLTSIGFIVYSFVLTFPPKTPLPVGLLIIGIFGVITSLAGLIGSYCWRSCLQFYVICGSLLTLGQLGVILALIFNLDGTVNQIVRYKQEKTPDWDNVSSVRTACSIGRWFFLAALILQAVGMVIAAYLYIRRPPSYDEYNEFKDDQERQMSRTSQHAVQLEHIKDGPASRVNSTAFNGPPGDIYRNSATWRQGSYSTAAPSQAATAQSWRPRIFQGKKT